MLAELVRAYEIFEGPINRISPPKRESKLASPRIALMAENLYRKYVKYMASQVDHRDEIMEYPSR